MRFATRWWGERPPTAWGRFAVAVRGAGITQLADCDRAELVTHWRRLYEREPPVGISRPLLLRAIAYRMQEEALGGLKPATHRLLRQCLSERQPSISANNLKIGTRLLREWHGTTYEVTILEKEVLFNGKKYGSLTEVAQVITGAKWSGPAFFGLRRKSYG